MIPCAEVFMSSMRLSTRRATNSAPIAPSAAKNTSEIASARTITLPIRARSPRSCPINSRKPPGQNVDPYERRPPAIAAPAAAIGDGQKAAVQQHLGGDLLDIAGERFADRIGEKVKGGAGFAFCAPR